MSRRLVWIVPAVLVFLAVSFELARYLSASGAERTDVIALLRDQARGDVPAMLARLDGCAADPPCAAQVQRNAARLKTEGRVKILLLESGSAYKLSTSTGLSRVAWTALDVKGPTVVQCVTVRKRWSMLHGARVELERIGPRIGDEASC
ncbi:MAG: hypothetical protein JWM31_3225 [Solirubrobacterales bacterium]|nr:hypothetical protein [Solirubrobacterales bacterium]